MIYNFLGNKATFKLTESNSPQMVEQSMITLHHAIKKLYSMWYSPTIMHLAVLGKGKFQAYSRFLKVAECISIQLTIIRKFR